MYFPALDPNMTLEDQIKYYRDSVEKHKDLDQKTQIIKKLYYDYDHKYSGVGGVAINYNIRVPMHYGMLYDPNGKFLGKLENELQLRDVCIQIAKAKVSGYYVMWNKNKIKITETGAFEDYPRNWCDRVASAVRELIHTTLEQSNLPDKDYKEVDWRQ
jgi:hypothetical protein